MKIFLQKYVLLFYGLCYSAGLVSAQEIRIYYPYDAYHISDADVALLHETVRKNPDMQWRINGRASSSGSKEYNFKLSSKRVQQVNLILKGAGISSADILLTYNGKDYADAQKEQPADRVVIIQWKPKLIAETPNEEKPVSAENVTTEKVKPSTATLRVSVFDALDKKPILGLFTINGNQSEFKHSFETEPGSTLIKISSPGYRDTIVNIKPGQKEFRVEILPDYVVEKLVAENIYFFPGTPEIIPESFQALQNIYNQLKGRKGVNIEIRGHVNWPTYNPTTPDLDAQHQKLSEQRAMAVMNWLTKKGIAAEILSYKGLGATQMLYPLATSEGHQAYNRRVEVLILKKP